MFVFLVRSDPELIKIFKKTFRKGGFLFEDKSDVDMALINGDMLEQEKEMISEMVKITKIKIRNCKDYICEKT